jgi:hypothetical protein
MDSTGTHRDFCAIAIIAEKTVPFFWIFRIVGWVRDLNRIVLSINMAFTEFLFFSSQVPAKKRNGN